MSETPKKKTPAKKSAAAKKKTAVKKAPAKKVGTGKRGRPPKNANYKANAKDTDKDSLITNDMVASAVDPLIKKVQDEALELADKVDDVVEDVAEKVVIFANDVKKKSLRDRMLKWFKRKK